MNAEKQLVVENVKLICLETLQDFCNVRIILGFEIVVAIYAVINNELLNMQEPYQ